jgi:hypothetical protein
MVLATAGPHRRFFLFQIELFRFFFFFFFRFFPGRGDQPAPRQYAGPRLCEHGRDRQDRLVASAAHTMATLMLEGGADIRFIQQMLGHASLAATELYTHVSIRMLKQVHAATHPAAHLEKKEPASQTENDEAARAELLATLDAEAESEDDEEKL